MGKLLPDQQPDSDTQQKILDQQQARAKELEQREKEDLAGIEAQYQTTVGELTESQKLEKERAEGKVYYRGYVFKSQVDELTRLDQTHRLEMNNLLQQKTSAIQKAQRFYEDQDYENTRLQWRS